MALQLAIPGILREPPALFPGAERPAYMVMAAVDQINAGYRNLAAAVIARAIQDAKRGDLEAQEFLEEDGLFWFTMAGLHVQPAKYKKRVRAWIANGCPK